MIIPNKHSGYQAGIRLYYINGGGPPAPVQTSDNAYTSQNRPGYQSTGTNGQFNQPIYRPQPQNYTTTNPLGVSQYGTQQTPQSMVDSAYAGQGRYGSGNAPDQVDLAGRQYHINELSTGKMAPQDFNRSFNFAAQQSPVYQNNAGYSGGYNGYGSMGGSFMPQMQTPFNPYTNSYMQGLPSNNQYQPRASSGPSQAIVSRSAQMRGTPNVISRAEGGIASLLDKE